MDALFFTPNNNVNSRDIIEALGKISIEFQDNTQLGLQDKVTQEGLPTPSHLCMSPIWPREHKPLPAELGGYVRSVGK